MTENCCPPNLTEFEKFAMRNGERNEENAKIKMCKAYKDTSKTT